MEHAVPLKRYSVEFWWSYLDAIEEVQQQNAESSNRDEAKANSSNNDNNNDASTHSQGLHVLDWTYRRALSHLPRSYKIWKRYWEFLMRHERQQQRRRRHSEEALLSHKEEGQHQHLHLQLPLALDRALWTCHGFPRTWIVYFEFLERNPTYHSLTYTRRFISRCLQSLPLTQHDKVWPAIRRAVAAVPNLPPETHAKIFSRQAQLNPSLKREYGEFLMQAELWGAAANVYWQMLNGAGDNANEAPSVVTTVADPESLWLDFVRLCAQHPRDVLTTIPWEQVLSNQLTGTAGGSSAVGSSSSSSTVGQLWSLWAESYVRRGNFDKARTLYERGMQSVRTLQDFTIVYNAYLQMEEELLSVLASQVPEEEEEEEEAAGPKKELDGNPDSESDEWEILLDDSAGASSSSVHQAQLQLEWALARAEHLTSRRPVWLNQVMLRQNPNDVGEWLKRSQLLGGGRPSTQALEDALRTVQSSQAVNGNPTQLVSQLLQLYESTSLEQARELMDRICLQNVYRFRTADDLAECWTMWIELELRHESWDDALSLSRQAVAPYSGSTTKADAAAGSAPYKSQQSKAPRPWNLTKSLRLWDLRLDLEESLGTVQTTKDAYNRALAIKAATVQHVLNYCAYLTEHKYFEESFTVYERGLELFAFPHKGAKILWKEYLQSFLKRYQGTKVERARDIFQRCLEACPAEECSEFFLLNAEFEEQHGLAKRALGVYRAMCERVPKDEKLTAYRLFITKTTKYLGLTATRDIYQDALDKLDDDKSVAHLCLDFVKMETSLQQIDRARGIFAYGAQLADPRRLPEYWKTWNEFEIAHGNEETFRDMLRVKRSVEAAFSTVNYNATGMNDAVKALSDAEAMRMIASQEGVDLEEQGPKTSVTGFVAGKRPAASVANLEEVEERVAKLRKVAADDLANDSEGPRGEDRDDSDEIEIDDIDAEIAEAAAEGAAAADSVQEVSTRAVPPAVFGDLVTGSSTDS
jgi:pre-mRNA-splicing factor SYF1